MDTQSVTEPIAPSPRTSQDPLRRTAVLIIALLAPMVAWSGFAGLRSSSSALDDANGSTPANTLPELTIDPNTAPWWELTIVPGIGETYAKRIVQYRETHAALAPGGRVFEHASDLQRIRGIGPRTVERMRPFLSLDVDR